MNAFFSKVLRLSAVLLIATAGFSRSVLAEESPSLADWRLDCATNGLVAVKGKPKVPADVRKSLWEEYREHIGYERVQMGRPTLVATNEWGGIYDLPFETEDGARHHFGVFLSDDARRPVYWTCEECPNDAVVTSRGIDGFVEARFFPGGMGNTFVSVCEGLAKDATITLGFGDETVATPFDEYSFLFFDDSPLANWGHPARCVFVNQGISAFAVLYVNMPPCVKVGGMDVNMRAWEIGGKNVGKGKRKAQARATDSGAAKKSGAKGAFPAIAGGDASNCYALLVSGGCNETINHGRYWNEICFAYNMLRKRYGLPRENIKVLWASGNPENDLCWKTSSCKLGRSPYPEYDCANWNFHTTNLSDFDEDGNDDITGAATVENMVLAFNDYRDTLTATDQLFVFVTDHGDPYTGKDATWNEPAVIDLWGDFLADVELAAISKDVKCPIMFAFETCYSGGMRQEILDSNKNRVVATADSYDSSTSGCVAFDIWAYNFLSALCGYYPEGYYPKSRNPEEETSNWLSATVDVRSSGEICNADRDGDGKVCFYEAAMFAMENNPRTAANGNYGQSIDEPSYSQSSANLGKKLFMTQYADAPAVVVKEKVLKPTLSPSSGSLGYAPATVTASCGTPGATIRYTTNGSEPTARSAVYSGGITLTGDAIISVRAFKSGMDASDIARVSYVVRKTAPEKALITSVSQGDSSSGIVVSWLGGDGTSYYSIRRSEAASMANAVTIAQKLPVDTYSYLDDTAAVGKDYYYQVVSFNDYGSTVSAVSQAGRRTLSAPASVNVTWNSGIRKFQVSWSAVTGASHYRVYLSVNDADPVAVSAWQTGLAFENVPNAAIGSKIRYYVAAAVSSSGQGMTSLVPSDVQTMPDARDWQLVIDRYATQKCQMLPGDSKKFKCYLKYSDGTFERVTFTTGVKWEIDQSGSRVSHNDSNGSYTGMSGTGIYIEPSTTLKAESGDYEEEIVLRATYTKSGETRSCDYPISVSNRRIVSGVYVGVPDSYMAPGDEMSVSCRRSYLNSDATGFEDVGEESYAIIAGGGAAIDDDGTLTAFPTDTKTDVTIQVTYRNADGFFTATKKIDISPQIITTVEIEIPALGGYSPTNEIGKIGYQKPGLNGLSWKLDWEGAS